MKSHQIILNQTLSAEAFEKCIYCEEQVPSSQFGDVEHILPKAQYPNLYLNWQNLALACEVCNNAKSNREGFVNPFVDDPDSFVEFAGPMMVYKPGDEKGMITVRGLKLNRVALLNRRAIELGKLIDYLDLIESSSEEMKPVLQEGLEKFTDSTSQYCSMFRKFLS